MTKRFEINWNKRVGDTRAWSVWENDGTEDGRLVATSMTEEDAHLVTKLLNEFLPQATK